MVIRVLYKGKDLDSISNRVDLKDYFNPYEYNLDNFKRKINRVDMIYEPINDIEEKAK